MRAPAGPETFISSLQSAKLRDKNGWVVSEVSDQATFALAVANVADLGIESPSAQPDQVAHQDHTTSDGVGILLADEQQ